MERRGMIHSFQSSAIISTPTQMDPLCVLKVEVWQQKFLGKVSINLYLIHGSYICCYFQEWKSYIAAVFAESEFGKARIELFNSPKKIKSMEPNKIILLDQCVSIKIPKKEGKFNEFLILLDLYLAFHLQQQALAFPYAVKTKVCFLTLPQTNALKVTRLR